MKWSLLTVLITLSLTYHLSTYATSATFDLKTQQLHIPQVDVLEDGVMIGTFETQMQLIPDTTYDFKTETLNALEDTNGPIIKRIKERQKLVCGVNDTARLTGGFAFLDENNRVVGFNADFCRAIGAAILGDPEKVAFTFVRPQFREMALEQQVDVLINSTTWTSTRQNQWGHFTWITFYDGQGFMVRKDSGITTLEQLNEAKICVTRGTTTELNLNDIFKQKNLNFTPVAFADSQVVFLAYEDGQCQAITGDKSKLGIWRFGAEKPDDHIILDITISKEPLAPLVPFWDMQWANIVQLVIYGLINAEELGITQANVDEMMKSDNPEINRLLGVESSIGQADLGLEPAALAQAIKAVGHYGEIYERYMGTNGINIPRDLNRLWKEGGLIYAPPLR